MANVLLVANLNCDRILLLDKPLTSGGRFHYHDGGQRLGGGGANTGLGLVWAGHRVALVSQVGRDKVGDWLLAETSTAGIDCHLISRRPGNTCEMLLMMTPNGDRTIIRPQRPIFELPVPPRWQRWDVLYINSSAEGAVSWAKTALEHCLVVGQLAKDERQRPCHILITSASDLAGRASGDLWLYAKDIAGDSLQHFIVTDGPKGAKAYSETGTLHVPARPANVVDTTGAGDVYAAGLIHGLVSGLALQQAMEEAAIWAAIAVESESSTPGEALKDHLAEKEAECHTTATKPP